MKRKNSVVTLSGVLLFFISNAVTVTVTMFLYTYVNKKTNGDKLIIAAVVLLAILFLSVLWAVVDIIRRRIMIDKPVDKILDATERIAKGDFTVRLPIEHGYSKYNQYDLIMENINILAAELEKSEVLKADFVSNVSHELKTPITVIHSYATLLQEEKDEEKRKKYAEILVSATARLSNLVTNILKLNKLENQKIIPEIKQFRLDESLAESVLALEEIIEKKNIELVCDLEEMDVLSSQSYLEIVWNNLLSNAIKFTNEGGRVEITLKKVGKNAVVTVSDTGCGISPETGAHIFDKFYQGDTSHAKEGNGLGLALVKKVIDVLGGEISVSSELGKGSTFKVTLKDTAV